ncbi:META domain-containing protein [Actinoplanes hulinensis]|uniref:META domain-containing protein n=1 Tax=Actinoplanes hulinensis TaxID=1144547 RepID=UPI001C672F42|nr:META domain-containing protein [Actinoplanes hulinensis]
MTDSPVPDRRSRWLVPLVVAAGLAAVIAVGVVLMRIDRDTSAPVGDLLPSASPGVASSSYADSHWRLTAVTEGSVTTAIPASVDAWLELATDGTVLAFDGVNAINGTFKATSAGFDIYGGPMTAVLYGGNDPGVLAAESGMGLLMSGPPPVWTASPDASGAPPIASGAPTIDPETSPVHVTVLAATPELLTLQASGARLAFVRTGPAEKVNATPIPDNSSAPGS